MKCVNGLDFVPCTNTPTTRLMEGSGERERLFVLRGVYRLNKRDYSLDVTARSSPIQKLTASGFRPTIKASVNINY